MSNGNTRPNPAADHHHRAHRPFTHQAAMATDTNVKLAVLIDADNAQPSVANALLAEVAKYGTAYVRQPQRLEGAAPHAIHPSSRSSNLLTHRVKT